MMEHPVVSLKGVTKSYNGFELGPVDLEIEPGYVVAVVGPNGSGKSTLFRMLMNLVHPDGGEIRLFGMKYPRDEVRIKQRTGYVPETSSGHDEMTATELGSFVSCWYETWSFEVYRELLRRFDIDPNKKFRKLSKGTRRRLAFALAAATRAELLLLDEPTEGVDPFARREMLEAISEHTHDGDRTVVFATHVMEEVRRLADYVVFLVNGEFLGLYEKDALLEQWRSLWVDGPPDGDLPGVVSVEEGTPVRLVSRSPRETHEALAERGIGVVRSGALDLEEVLALLMAERQTGERRSVR